MSNEKQVREAQIEAKRTTIGYLRAWGESSVTPAVTASLIAAQHLQPPQFLPLLFPPLLLFSSYMNISDYKVDAAGTSAAWSALYLVLAQRRKRPFMQRFGVRGVVRGTTMGLCAINVAAGGFVYATGKRRKDSVDDA